MRAKGRPGADADAADSTRAYFRVPRGLLKQFYVAAAAEGINKRTAFIRAMTEFVAARRDLLAALGKEGPD